ncbi:MAG: RtcB family protein [Fimbriimonadales bacterium]|nr:RtcB family protein [Fimbriimonadales bacterium]
MRFFEDVPVWGDPVDEGALRQIRTCRKTAERAAMMADHHRGYSVPIGGVVAYRDAVSPSAVGFDIACGNKAVRLDVPLSEVLPRIGAIMDDLYRTLSFGLGRTNPEPVEDPVFEDERWRLPVCKQLKDLAHAQFGTIGGGNHFVDLFADEVDRLWIGVHFGSRGFGHRLATHFLRAGGGRDDPFSEPVVLSVRSALGSDYLQAMELAGRYAYAARDWVCARVARLLGARTLEEVHNHHNYAWRERHDGEDLWVVRKGATPAFPGQRSFVGGSMGDLSVILEGLDSEEARLTLRSTVHGAGRVLSRTEAAGRGRGRRRKPGKVSREMMEGWVKAAGVVLRGGGVDESPHCYRRLPEVLRHHERSVRILHTLRPIGVAMAGEDVQDPYKD